MEQSQESQSSIFDFIYLYTKRIALYLSRLNKYDNLTGWVRSVQQSDEEKAGFRAGIGPRGARAEVRAEATEGQSTGIQKQYDTQWKQPIEFLKELQDRDMVKRTFEDVELGDIFILPGNLSLIDVGMFGKVWEVVANQARAKGQAQAKAANNLKPQIGNVRRSKGRDVGQPTQPAPAPLVPDLDPSAEWGLRLLGALAQPVFLNFQSKGRRFWALADEAAIIGDGASLVYKHGLTIPGTWHMLAILDAMDDDVGVGEDW